MKATTKNPSPSRREPSRRPHDWSAEQRLEAVLRAASMNEQELGAYLRQAGLRSTDLERWKESMLLSLRPEAQRRAQRRNTRQNQRIRELEKELRRKDKALAETAALLALKKKAQAIWGDPDDDIP